MEEILKSYPAYRLKQAKEAVFQKLLNSWDEATNLPQELRERLNQECPLSIEAVVEKSAKSTAQKAAIKLKDGNLVETVLMKHEPLRNTVCVSSQVGCALGCDFCATGKAGLLRDLSYGEILEQLLFFARILKESREKISSVVFMGMGEPLLNYDEVMKAIEVINAKDGLGIGARHISISTVGIVPGIEKLTQEPKQINLAFSLHSADDELRSKLMPINRKYPLTVVLAAIKKYIEKTGRKVMIEYLLLGGVNDSNEAAEELAKLLKKSLPKLFFVNLIGFNAAGIYKAASAARQKAFRTILEKVGIQTTARYRFGEDVKAACGQLAGRENTSLL